MTKILVPIRREAAEKRSNLENCESDAWKSCEVPVEEKTFKSKWHPHFDESFLLVFIQEGQNELHELWNKLIKYESQLETKCDSKSGAGCKQWVNLINFYFLDFF